MFLPVNQHMSIHVITRTQTSGCAANACLNMILQTLWCPCCRTIGTFGIVARWGTCDLLSKPYRNTHQHLLVAGHFVPLHSTAIVHRCSMIIKFVFLALQHWHVFQGFVPLIMILASYQNKNAYCQVCRCPANTVCCIHHNLCLSTCMRKRKAAWTTVCNTYHYPHNYTSSQRQWRQQEGTSHFIDGVSEFRKQLHVSVMF